MKLRGYVDDAGRQVLFKSGTGSGSSEGGLELTGSIIRLNGLI